MESAAALGSAGAPHTLPPPPLAPADDQSEDEAGVAPLPLPLLATDDGATEPDDDEVADTLDWMPICCSRAASSSSLVVVAWIVVLPSRQLFRAF